MIKTIELRRDQVKPGMVIKSSHGYRLLITEVEDNAVVRTDERHIGFVGHLHASREADTRRERYPAGSTVPVEVDENDFPILHLAFGATPPELLAERAADWQDWYGDLDSTTENQDLVYGLIVGGMLQLMLDAFEAANASECDENSWYGDPAKGSEFADARISVLHELAIDES